MDRRGEAPWPAGFESDDYVLARTGRGPRRVEREKRCRDFVLHTPDRRLSRRVNKMD